MLGLVCYRDGERGAPEVRTIRGTRFYTVPVSPGAGLAARWSLLAAARALRRADVRQAVFLVDAPRRAFLEERGVTGVSPVPLHRAAAAAIARRCLTQSGIEPKRATIALAASGVTPELCRAAAELAADVRYLTLCVPRGGETLARSLRHDLGVAARLAGRGEPLAADLTLCFDPCAGASGATVPLYDPALAVEYDDALPAELLAALWRSGAVAAEELRVKFVRLSEEKACKS